MLVRKVELVEPTLKNVVVLYGHSVLGEREATNDPSVSEHPDRPSAPRGKRKGGLVPS